MDVAKKRVVVFVKRWGYVPVVVIYCGAVAAALTTPHWSVALVVVWVALIAVFVGLGEWRRAKPVWRPTKVESWLSGGVLFVFMMMISFIVHGDSSWRTQLSTGFIAAMLTLAVTMAFRRIRYGKVVPPVDIRLHLRNDRTVSVDSRYIGVEEGLHVWEVITAMPGDEVERMTVAELPARTTIRLPAT